MDHSEPKSFRIEMIETALGCPEACTHCGAFNGKKSDLMTRPVSYVDLVRNLSARLKNGMPMRDLLSSHLTTYVNTEPLRSDAFSDLVHALCDLNISSQMVAISHGVRSGVDEMIRRLDEVIEYMLSGLVSLFVLTVDSARAGGRITPASNRSSYRLTMEKLGNVLGTHPVTASIQGTNDPNSPQFIGKARDMFEEVLRELGLEGNPGLRVNERTYTATGRARSLISLGESIDCDVIPDPDFVATLDRGHAWRGLITADGTVLAQPNRPGSTYGDSVNKSLWKPQPLSTHD